MYPSQQNHWGGAQPPVQQPTSPFCKNLKGNCVGLPDNDAELAGSFGNLGGSRYSGGCADAAASPRAVKKLQAQDRKTSNDNSCTEQEWETDPEAVATAAAAGIVTVLKVWGQRSEIILDGMKTNNDLESEEDATGPELKRDPFLGSSKAISVWSEASAVEISESLLMPTFPNEAGLSQVHLSNSHGSGMLLQKEDTQKGMMRTEGNAQTQGDSKTEASTLSPETATAALSSQIAPNL